MDPGALTFEGPYTTNNGGVQGIDGGITPASLSGTFIAASEPTNANTATTIGYGGGAAAELFNGLQIDALKAGTVVFTPSSTVGAEQYVTYVSGGASTTTAGKPIYAQVTAVAGVDTINNVGALTVVVQATGPTGTGTAPHTIISLVAAAPTGYGSQLTAPAGTATFAPGTATSTAITVNQVGGPTSYVAGFAHVVAATGTAMAFAQVNLGAAPVTGASEIYGLQVLVGGVAPSANQIGQIIQDINAGAATDGVTAMTPTASITADFGKAFNIELVGTASATSFLSFDFSSETNVAGVSVANIAAVPEPATAVGLLVGAGSLLLGRRKNRVA